MGVNNVNNGSPVVWSSLTSARNAERVDFTNSAKPANFDKFVLNLPTAETIYKRQEFISDERMGEGCAFCCTYMERTLTFADGKGGNLTVSGSSNDGYFVINLDKGPRAFGKSGSDMNNIEHAVEETRERKDRTMEQSMISVGLSDLISGNGGTVGGSFGFAAQTTTYKYTSVSETKGTIAYKNGGVGKYREAAASSRELYNKCAVFLAEAFGENSSELTLSNSVFNELFGKTGGNEKTFTANAAQKREKLANQLNKLQEFMEKKLAAVRQKDPNCGSLQTFADTYLKLGAYKYSDITSLVEKMFSAKD